MKKGTLCRTSSEDECELKEYCNGTSAACAPNLLVMDGHPCRQNTAFCYRGVCQTADKQCQEIFGKGGAACCWGSCFAGGIKSQESKPLGAADGPSDDAQLRGGVRLSGSDDMCLQMPETDPWPAMRKSMAKGTEWGTAALIAVVTTAVPGGEGCGNASLLWLC